MKKIMCLIDALRLGGAQRQLIGLTYLLKQKGYEVDLVKYYPDNFYENLFERYGFQPLTVSTNGSWIGKLTAMKRFIRQHHYDTVIAYLDGPSSLCCLLKALGLKCQVVVSERNTTHTPSRKERIKFLLYRFADTIIPNAYSQEQYITRHYPSLAHKTTTINNFTDTSYFTPSLTYTQGTQPFTILTPSRIARQKNVWNYLEAISIIKQEGHHVRFRWIGDVQQSETDYLPICIAKVHELGIDDIFEFLPASQDILHEYHQCDAVCLPSIYEGFPNAICEAMSCGKPILCSNVCDNPHIVTPSDGGYLFDPLSPIDIAAAIRRMINLSPSERAEIGKRNREHALSHFSKETFVEKYIHTLNLG